MRVSLILTRCANLGFLEEAVTAIERFVPEKLTIFRPGSEVEMIKVIEAIEQQPAGVVLIFSHGVDGFLLVHEHSRDDQGRQLPRWLLPGEIGCLKNKHVFCLACNSSSLMDSAKEAGALSFIGFGDIEHFRRGAQREKLDEPEFTAGYEECLVAFTICSLRFLFQNELPFEQLLAFVKLSIRKQALRYAREGKGLLAKEVAKGFLGIEADCVGFVS
jgi:hypothetical protein